MEGKPRQKNFDIIVSLQQNLHALYMEVSWFRVKVRQYNSSRPLNILEYINVLDYYYEKYLNKQVFIHGYYNSPPIGEPWKLQGSDGTQNFSSEK